MIKNAIVLMFDSLQFNYVACYGNTWIKTPNMDRLAREGVLFENCYTEGLPTVPCRRAMHTGRYTVQKAGWVALSMEDTTIADLCWGRPIDTAIVFDCPMYRLPKFGYTRGFDKVWFLRGHEGDDSFYEEDNLFHLECSDYFDDKSRDAFVKEYNEQATQALEVEMKNYLRQRQYGGEKEENRYVAKTIRKAIEYLEQVDKNKQFFLWIDSFDPHEPWDCPSIYDAEQKQMYDPDFKGKHEFYPYPGLVAGIYTEPQLNHTRMLYAECVTLCDKYLGVLMDYMRLAGLDHSTLLMMVSDHGEPMGNAEHGHGLMRKARPWPYEELVHTPLLLKAPGIKNGQRIKAFVQSCDVAPTVCDWLGIGVHPDMQGKSLLPLVRGEVTKVRDYALSGYSKYSWSLITEDWTYIHWLKQIKDDKDMGGDFYSGSVDTSHIKATNSNASFFNFSDAFNGQAEENEVKARYDALKSTDGEDQWTCTPGSTANLPEEDELYVRASDPFQLNNVIKQNPEKARELFDILRGFISELRAS